MSSATRLPATADVAPLGIMGGTFDPVHIAHLRLAEEARQALALEQVLWIPAGRPPHRAPTRASAQDRLEMVRLAVAGNPYFAVDDGEVRSAATSFTVTTLERLRRAHGPQRPLVLILGADAFIALDTWHRWRGLFDLAHFAVATRPGYSLTDRFPPALAAEYQARHSESAGALTTNPSGAVVCFPMTPLAVSASMARAELRAGRSVRYLIPDPVLDYIDRKGLYASHGR